MGVVLQASSRFVGICETEVTLGEQAVEVRNVQGSTHRVLKRDSSIHKTLRLRAVFIFRSDESRVDAVFPKEVQCCLKFTF